MTTSEDPSWQQMEFVPSDGRREVLWVVPEPTGTYRVLNVPVWFYGISVGSRVSGQLTDGPFLAYIATVAESPGATVRLFVAENEVASELYLNRILPDCRERELAIGPATFFDPRVVAIHVHTRLDWLDRMGPYLNELVDAGLADFWEVADPDAFPPEPEDVEEAAVSADREPLIHQRPPRERGEAEIA